jgi:hypothetical protein
LVAVELVELVTVVVEVLVVSLLEQQQSQLLHTQSLLELVVKDDLLTFVD